MKKKLSLEELEKIFSYNQERGVFKWLESPRWGINPGDIAGTKCTDTGYIKIHKSRTLYYAHRLAWLFMTGSWPIGDVDHKNRIRHDNKWSNLRSGNNKVQGRNKNCRLDNKSGIVGVSWNNKTEKWTVRIKDGKYHYLGQFINFDDAVRVRWKAEVARGWPGCYKDTTAFLYLKNKNLLYP